MVFEEVLISYNYVKKIKGDIIKGSVYSERNHFLSRKSLGS